MSKTLKDFIQILSQREGREEVLRMILEEEIEGKVKEILGDIALLKREAFCEEHKDRKNGFYQRNFETILGTIEDLFIPLNTGKGILSLLPRTLQENPLHPRRTRHSHVPGWVFHTGLAQTLKMLLEGKYSPGWISWITSLVTERVREWGERPTREWYPILFLDGVVLKVRRDTVSSEAVYLALGINEEGDREVLGFWVFGVTERARAPQEKSSLS